MLDRGGSFYDDADTHARYQLARHRADSPNEVMEGPALWALLGSVDGARVLDLGCGDGRFGLDLLAAGAASYTGVDGSARMCALAKGLLAPHVQAHVRHADLEEVELPAAGFDLVTSRLALHYVKDLTPVIARICSALSKDGRVVISVLHPLMTCYTPDADAGGVRSGWQVADYFLPGPRRREWMGAPVTWQHRTLADWVALLSTAGLVLTGLSEAPPVAGVLSDEQLHQRAQAPMFLVLSARRA